MASPIPEIALVTANVGSIFELTQEFREQWVSTFVEDVITRHETLPVFIALHCQELGGKGFKNAMDDVDDFILDLSRQLKNHGFKKRISFVDKALDRFTALGSMYYFHESIAESMRIWNFKTKCFEELLENEDHPALEVVQTVHKHKFAADMTPEHRASRKGFVRVRFQLSEGGPPIELVNVHLFHDESNLVAMEKFPSVYTETRRRALTYALRRAGRNVNDGAEKEDDEKPGPMFVFGDFNFRLDTQAVVSWLCAGTSMYEHNERNNSRKEYFIFAENPKVDEPRTILFVEKKIFNIGDEKTRNMFHCDLNRKKLLSHDKELEYFNNELHEFEIDFPPSYPYSEKISEGNSFGGSRCPAWCDRVLFNDEAKQLGLDKIQYDLIGKNVCMGDHKPVILRLRLGDTGKETESQKEEEHTKQPVNEELANDGL